jgi:hypothetical protein
VGAFGQLSYEVIPNLTITGGARITNDSKSTRLLKTADTGTGAVTYTGRRFVELEDTKESWDVSALYKLGDNASVYARVAQGLPGPDHPGPLGGVQFGLHHCGFGDDPVVGSRREGCAARQSRPLRLERLLLHRRRHPAERQ